MTSDAFWVVNPQLQGTANMALNSTSTVNSTYNPIGTDYPDNLRIGNFMMGNTNSVGRGVQVGNPILFTIAPTNGQNLSTQSVAAGGFFPLSTAAAPPAAVVDTTNNVLRLDVERQLQITTTGGAFTAIVSGYDRYKQKIVYTAASSAGPTFTFATDGGLSEVTSVQLLPAVPGATYTYIVMTTYTFSLPFCNYTDDPNPNYNTFTNPTANGNAWFSVNAGTTPRRAFRAFSYNPVIVAAAPNAKTRPTFVVSPAVTPTMGVICMEMFVKNYGFSWIMNEAYNLMVNRTASNSLRKIIGPVPYNIGWTAWKG